MSKISEFHPDTEREVVGRVLLVVHKAIDEAFPGVKSKDKKFAKTVFSEGMEETKIEDSDAEKIRESVISNTPHPGKTPPRNEPKAPRRPSQEQITIEPSRFPESKPATEQAKLEYSDLQDITESNSTLSAAKKLFYLFLVVLILSIVVAIWLNRALISN